MIVYYCSNKKCSNYNKDVKSRPENEICPICKQHYMLERVARKRESQTSLRLADANKIENKLSNDIVLKNNMELAASKKSNGFTPPDAVVTNTQQAQKPIRRLRTANGLSKEGSLKQKPGIAKLVRDCFIKHEVIGMDSVQRRLNAMYQVFDNENMKEMQGNKSKEDQTIRNKHFLISSESGSGKELLTEVLVDLLRDMGIRTEKPGKIVFSEFQTAVLSNEPGDLDRLFQDCNDKVVYFDGKIDELFFDENKELKMNHYMIKVMQNLIQFYRGKCTFIFSSSGDCREKLLQSMESGKEYLECLKIENYSPEEMIQIIEKVLKNQYSNYLEKRAHDYVLSKLRNYRFHEEKTLGNYIKQMRERAEEKLSARIVERDNAGKYVSPEERVTYIVQDMEEEEMDDTYIKKLEAMIGLKKVKEQVKILKQQIENQTELKRRGELVEGFSSLNMRFVGAPGTGKTTVARLIGKIYQNMGILSGKDVFVECKGDKDLVADHVGGTQKKVKAILESAEGGVLFIDEAYTLTNSSFGEEAVDSLLSETASRGGDLVVILAGYEDEINKLCEVNKGLKSRFPIEINFENYSEDELSEIFKYQLKAKNYLYDKDVEDVFRDRIYKEINSSDFANARTVQNIVDECIANLNMRVSIKDSTKVMKTIKKEDLWMKEDEEKVDFEDAISELKSMTGLAEVKEEIEKLARFQAKQKKRLDAGLPVANAIAKHVIFSGNPGTGKTTVARMMGKIYQSLGLLSRGHVVEVTRQSLVAGYVGQTAEKTKDVINKAQGGILFIDEAYDLVRGGKEDFGQEALNTLLPVMENVKGDFMVIAAGYKNAMEEFKASNEGFTSRFKKTLYFTDYSGEELWEIFQEMCVKEKYKLSEEAEKYVRECFQKIDAGEIGNGRGVRNIFEEIIVEQASNEDEDLSLITLENTENVLKKYMAFGR